MNKDSESLLDTTNEALNNESIQIGSQAGSINNSNRENLGNTKVVEETTNIERTNSEQLVNLSITNSPPDSLTFDSAAYLNSIKEKESLNRTFSPSSDIIVNKRAGLRSDSNVIHSELTEFQRKRSSKLLTEMDLDKCTALIPTCTGPKNVSEFINACDIAIEAVEKSNKDLLIKIINSKLSGTALEACKYRDTTSWENIKTILKGAFEHKASERALTLGLNFARIRENETVASFAGRIEELYYKLCIASSERLTEAEAELNRKQLKHQALIIFINGLPNRIKLALKARAPDSLEQAMVMARDEELEHNANLQVEKLQEKIERPDSAPNNNFRPQNYRQNYNQNRANNIRHNNGYNNMGNQGFNRNNYNNNYGQGNFGQNGNGFTRNNNGQHVNRNGYSNQQNSNRNNNVNFNKSNEHGRQNSHSNNFNAFQRNPNMTAANINCYICGRNNHIARNCRQGSQMQRNYTHGGQPNGNMVTRNNNMNASAPPICNYCNKSGHIMTACYSKQRDERSNNNLNSNPPAVSGVRLVNQILETPSSCDASTSYQV